MANYESIGRFCSNLERICDLEKLINEGKCGEEGLRIYRDEHRRLVNVVDSYLSRNYPNGSFSAVLDIWQYMQEQQREKVTEAVLVQSSLMEKEREVQKKKRDELVAKIKDFRDFLNEHYKIRDSE